MVGCLLLLPASVSRGMHSLSINEGGCVEMGEASEAAVRAWKKAFRTVPGLDGSMCAVNR